MPLQDRAINLVKVTIRAYNADGYWKDIATMSDRQIHMTESRVKEVIKGLSIDPAQFPEMVRFEVLLENVYS